MPAKETEKIVKFLQTTFKKHGFKKAIVAVSGGVDSATSLLLAVKALGKDNVYSLQLPYKKYQSLELANLIIQKADIAQNQCLIINIGRAVDKLAVKLNAKKNPLRLGNIIARVRMACLYDQAKKFKALVIGTENRSEQLLGYFTRFGDQACDLDPLVHLYKTQVCQLAQHLGVPEPILKRPPTAGLWPDQTDESELGFNYSQADPILQLYFDQKLLPPEIIKKGFDQKLVTSVLQRVKDNTFKHLTPYTINGN